MTSGTCAHKTLKSQHRAWRACQTLWKSTPEPPQTFLCGLKPRPLFKGQKEGLSAYKPASCTGKAGPWDQTYFFLISTRLELFNLPSLKKKKKKKDKKESALIPKQVLSKSQVSFLFFSLWRQGPETICPFCLVQKMYAKCL